MSRPRVLRGTQTQTQTRRPCGSRGQSGEPAARPSHAISSAHRRDRRCAGSRGRARVALALQTLTPRLFQGHLVLDVDVPSMLLEKCRFKEGNEFTKMRYTAVTGDPDKFVVSRPRPHPPHTR